eukprot:12053538-Ditylum_brightwellii.AAC.1
MQRLIGMRKRQDWKSLHHSVDELTTYCSTWVQPAQKKFNHPDGDIYKVEQWARVAQLFSPFFVKETSIAALELLADVLTFFGPGYDSISLMLLLPT